MKWSNEQLKAIEESNKSILVSAGAGSGKTAVLTERLLKKIENGTKIQDLTVLTFTVMASSEMKERLRSALAASSNPLCLEQLAFIDEASIETFDAFTNEIVRKYHYLLDIPSTFNIVSSNDFLLISKKIIGDIFNELYIKQEINFTNFIDKFSVKDDQNITNYCLKIYQKIRLNPSYLDILNSYEQYYQPSYVNKLINEYTKMINKMVNCANDVLHELRGYASDVRLNEHFNKLCEILLPFTKTLDYDELVCLTNIKFPSLPPKKKDEDEEEKENYTLIYNDFKKKIDDIKKRLIYNDIDELRQSYLDTASDAIEIVKILKELDSRLKLYKKQTCSYDFTDIALMAIEIIENNDFIKEELKDKTCEILIDEYQDTSDLQEHLINLISQNNVYMVGDIKQSIYRFRNANPHIFKIQYQKLKTTPPNLVIDLSQNFRSRKEVLNAVNLIFSSLMSEKVGGVDYNEAHELHYGFTTYDEMNDENYQMKVLTYDSKQEDESLEFDKVEIEAFIIAQDILKRINHFKVYHKKTNKYEQATFSDFAILVQDKGQMDKYCKIFEYFGLPLKAYQDIVLTKNNDIYALLNLLKLIYTFIDPNYKQDNLKEVLTSFLRSFIVNLKDEDIFKIITSANIVESFKNSLNDLYAKCEKCALNIGKMNLTNSLDYIFKTFNIFEKMLRLTNISEVEYRLNYLFQIAKNLTSLNYTYQEMLDYLSLLIASNDFEIKIPSSSSNNNNVISMMTIHASKGLEFPICYFPELYKKFNFSDMNELFLYSSDYQIVLPFLKEQLLKKSLTYFLEKEKYVKEEISEKIRLLYVALTRPREQIILLLPTCEKKIVGKTNDMNKMGYTSFKDMFDSIDEVITPYKEKIKTKDLNLTKKYLYGRQKMRKELLDTSVLIFNDVKLEKKDVTSQKASISKINYYTKEELLKMDRGKKIHKLLEIMDFSSPNYDGIPTQDLSLIQDFFNHSFIKNLKIINHYHEYNFIIKENDTVINGVIDLILETSDAYYIIDYKLSNLSKEEYTNQLNIYKSFLKKVVDKPVYTYLYSIVKNQFLEV